MSGRTAIIAGNGPSLAQIAPGRLTADDTVFRCNSFFLEDRFHVGTRADMVYIGGDRAAPFIADTLRDACGQYQLSAWTTARPRIERFVPGRLSLPFQPMRYRDAETEAFVTEQRARYDALPTGGTLCLLLADALGFDQLLVAGIDLYSGGPQRYAFQPGPRMRRLMGGDFGTRGWDLGDHHPDLDRRILEWLVARPHLTVRRVSDPSPIADLMDLTAPRDGPPLDQPLKDPIGDWTTSSAEVTTIAALRTARIWQKRLTARLLGRR